MEPVTHMLTGAVLARAGFNRKAAYATAGMAIAAEMPDCDMVASLWGPVAGFQHHRGITHTFVALPVEAAVVTLVFYAWHRLRKEPAVSGSKKKAPVSWAWLFAGTLVALLSHLLHGTGRITTAYGRSHRSIRTGTQGRSCSSLSRCCLVCWWPCWSCRRYLG